MKLKLANDWTLKASNGSDVVVPKGTKIDMPEAADETHAREVAAGAKIPVDEPTPPANEGVEDDAPGAKAGRPAPKKATAGRPKGSTKKK